MDLSSPTWRKAVKSGENGGACLEVARVSGMIAVRDSKDPTGPKLIMSHDDFRRFAEVLKSI